MMVRQKSSKLSAPSNDFIKSKSRWLIVDSLDGGEELLRVLHALWHLDRKWRVENRLPKKVEAALQAALNATDWNNPRAPIPTKLLENALLALAGRKTFAEFLREVILQGDDRRLLALEFLVSQSGLDTVAARNETSSTVVDRRKPNDSSSKGVGVVDLSQNKSMRQIDKLTSGDLLDLLAARLRGNSDVATHLPETHSAAYSVLRDFVLSREHASGEVEMSIGAVSLSGLTLPSSEESAVQRILDLNQRIIGQCDDTLRKAHITELQAILTKNAGALFEPEQGKRFRSELSLAFKRLKVGVKCHQCGSPATLGYSIVGDYREPRWRFRHRGADAHKVHPISAEKSVESRLSSAIPELPYLTVVDQATS